MIEPLATIADMQARGVTVSTDEEAVVGTFLATASSAVRDAAGVPISQAPVTVDFPGTRSQRLKLPGAPVTAVSAVLLDGVANPDWHLRNGYLCRHGGWPADVVTVTYTAGLPEVPADIVDLACRMAARALDAYRAGSWADREAVQERVGDYSVRYADTGSASAMELSTRQRQRLRARFGGGAA